MVEDPDVGDDCESLSDGSEESVSSVSPLPKRSKGPSSQTNADIAAFIGKDGTTWEKTATLQGRAYAANIVQQVQGILRHARNLKDELEAFPLFLDPPIVPAL